MAARRTLLQILLAVAVLGCGGCASMPKLQPKGRVEIALHTDAERVDAKAKLANEVVIHLPPITVPGHEWTLVLNDERFLKQWRRIERTPDGGATVSFLAVRPGRRPLRFLAVANQAREAIPSQRYDITLEIEQ